MFVLNVMNNNGGNSDFPANFIYNINGIVHWNITGVELYSPATLQGDYQLFSTSEYSPQMHEYAEKVRNKNKGKYKIWSDKEMVNKGRV